MFFDADGAPLDRGGFDAVIGNPPWDTLRTSPDADPTTSRLARSPGSAATPAVIGFKATGTRTCISSSPNACCSCSKHAAVSGCCFRQASSAIMAAFASDDELLERCAIDAVLSFDNREATVSDPSRCALPAADRRQWSRHDRCAGGLRAALAGSRSTTFLTRDQSTAP